MEGDKPLEVNPRVSLLTLSTVRALRGCLTVPVRRDVESGKLLWVWDFSISKNAPDTNSQALRFWLIELLQRPGVKELSLEDVINQILPPGRATYSSGEFCIKFSTNKFLLHNLRQRTNWGRPMIQRDCLARFLTARWIGAQQR